LQPHKQRFKGTLNASYQDLARLNPGGAALSVDGAHVGGSVLLRYGFWAMGEVRLHRATITTMLDCEGGKFLHPKKTALDAEGVHVGGSVLMRTGFRARSDVRLHVVVGWIGFGMGYQKEIVIVYRLAYGAVSKGVTAFPCGSTAESACLTDLQHYTSKSVEQIRGRIIC
jgi:hypothetical protein